MASKDFWYAVHNAMGTATPDELKSRDESIRVARAELRKAWGLGPYVSPTFKQAQKRLDYLDLARGFHALAKLQRKREHAGAIAGDLDFERPPTFLGYGAGLRNRQGGGSLGLDGSPGKTGSARSQAPVPVVVTQMPKNDDRPNVVNVGGVTVNVQTNADPHAIAGTVGAAVGSSVSNALSDQHH